MRELRERATQESAEASVRMSHDGPEVMFPDVPAAAEPPAPKLLTSADVEWFKREPHNFGAREMRQAMATIETAWQAAVQAVELLAKHQWQSEPMRAGWPLACVECCGQKTKGHRPDCAIAAVVNHE